MPRQQRIVRLMWMVGALLLIGSTDPASAQARAELSASGAAPLPRCVDLRRDAAATLNLEDKTHRLRQVRLQMEAQRPEPAPVKRVPAMKAKSSASCRTA
jgi:hypothetical protein